MTKASCATTQRTLDRERPRIDAILAEYGVPLLPLRRTTAAQQ